MIREKQQSSEHKPPCYHTAGMTQQIFILKTVGKLLEESLGGKISVARAT
jgi:hypothetical protein